MRERIRVPATCWEEGRRKITACTKEQAATKVPRRDSPKGGTGNKRHGIARRIWCLRGLARPFSCRIETLGAAANRTSSHQKGRGQLSARAHLLVRNHWFWPGRCILPCRTDAAILGFAQGGKRGKAALTYRSKPALQLHKKTQPTFRPFPQNRFRRAGQVRRRRLGHHCR